MSKIVSSSILNLKLNQGKNSFEDSFNFPNQSTANKFHKEHLLQHQLPQHMLQNPSASSTDPKVRKRSANQAYEYLISLPDSKTFQDWLSSNETDFTWVHKRNSMTNAGKKYYYICNYRIKKGYTRCPAVIYALFPNNSDSTVMVYSCGDHEHSRLNGASMCSSSQQEQTFPSQSGNNNEWLALNKQQQLQNKSTNAFSYSPNQSNTLLHSPQQSLFNHTSAQKLSKQNSSGNLSNDLVTNIINTLQQRQRSNMNR